MKHYFNLLISRKKGRSKKGTRCTQISAGSKGSNVHVVGCMVNMRLFHYEVRKGSFKKPQTQEFVRNCLRISQTTYQTPVVMIIDNAPCHMEIEEVFAEEELLRLGPYSPMLDAIEYAWPSLKASVKSDIAIQMVSILSGDGRGSSTQTEFRLQQLEEIIHDNISITFTVSNYTRFIAHVQRFIPDALDLVNVIF